MNDLLRVRGLNKSFQSGEEKLRILVNLDLDLARGDTLSVTGASGCGKSTLLHLLGGMEEADSGRIILEGTDVTRLSGAALASFRNKKVGFIFQFHHLLPEFSALENVMFPLLLRRERFSKAAGKAVDLLKEVGLAERSHHRPGELSGGEQQRVAIARALVGDPVLLLADEPTGNLDEHTAEPIYQLLLDVHRSRRLTAIVVTHNSRLAGLCRVKKRLHEGRLEEG